MAAAVLAMIGPAVGDAAAPGSVTGAQASTGAGGQAPAGGSQPRTGLADARPAGLAVLNRPVVSFHRAIRAGVRRIRAERRRQQRELFSQLPGGVSPATLESIAACESGGNPTAISADGSYRGKYQFDYGTWESVGGSGDPAAASETEQDYRAALLYAQSGSSPWPICG
ncbi:MAG TPA: transglycosylase family protein [Solirubrobacterales bacterium]|nr:transglycosylase family protein [Solirubrobacterales bacterium]